MGKKKTPTTILCVQKRGRGDFRFTNYTVLNTPAIKRYLHTHQRTHFGAFCFSSSVLGSLGYRHLTQIYHHQSFTQEVCTRDFKWQSIWWRDHWDQWNRVCVFLCVCVFCNLNLQQEMATAVAMCAMQSSPSSVVVGAHSMSTPPQGAASTTPVSVAGPFRTQVNIFNPGFLIFFAGLCASPFVVSF